LGGAVEVSLRPIGGIFLRLDSSGNLNVYDTTGTSIAKFIGGVFSSKLNRGVAANNAPITGTTLGPVHTGYYSQITPQVSGALLIILETDLSHTVAGDIVEMAIYEKAGANTPAGNDPVTGWTKLTVGVYQTISTAAATNFVTHVYLASGRTVGTTYTYAAVITNQSVGGTASFTIQNAHPLVWEV
jgi:hypothetical protein